MHQAGNRHNVLDQLNMNSDSFSLVVISFVQFFKDEGGWNNIRMSMETAVAMAYVMGRTLVLPPAQGMYLLDKVRLWETP